ncbi:otoferlin-like [Tubulanus polymorphus]|uniref:otoferlin-like n=1 Tax=Tubulanus polymorphus TaxID=672921 RepID=UPI003DA45AA4
MALELQLRYVDNLRGKGNRFGRLSFRDYIYDTKTVASQNGSVYFGETYRWPLGTSLTGNEVLRMAFYNKSKFSKTFIGEFSMILQSLITDFSYTSTETLIDANQQSLRTCVSFEVIYTPPDGANVKWKEEDFNFPMFDNFATDETDGGTADGIMESMDSEQNIMSAMSAMAEPQDEELSPEDDEEINLNLSKGQTKKPMRIEPTMDKVADYQVTIHIQSVRLAVGSRILIRPALILQVGPYTQKTNKSAPDDESSGIEKEKLHVNVCEVRMAVGKRLEISCDLVLTIDSYREKTTMQASSGIAVDVSVSVEEGKNFSGANINPSLIVTVGNVKEGTQTASSLRRRLHTNLRVKVNAADS